MLKDFIVCLVLGDLNAWSKIWKSPNLSQAVDNAGDSECWVYLMSRFDLCEDIKIILTTPEQLQTTIIYSNQDNPPRGSLPSNNIQIYQKRDFKI